MTEQMSQNQELRSRWHVNNRLYARSLLKWTALAILIGVVCGLAGAAFNAATALAAASFHQHGWLLYLLPAAGLLIVFLYHHFASEVPGTDTLIEACQTGQSVRLHQAPVVFVSTCLTHLCGGSAGRTGAALQIGGDLGNQIGRRLHLDADDMKAATMIGMAACFSVLFGTPLASSVFVVLMIHVGVILHAVLYPALLASLLACGINASFGFAPLRYALEVPDFTLFMALKVMGLGILCGLLASFFLHVLHGVRHAYQKYLPGPRLRIVVGGFLVVLVTLLSGSRSFNGSGMALAREAILSQQALPWAFLLKILLTALTMGAGYQGGEVAPSFVIGATFGCVIGPLLGLPAGFAAALGMMGVFSGVTNCPLATILLALEIFQGKGYLSMALVCILSSLCSGYSSLYSRQGILFSKYKVMPLDIRGNQVPDAADILQKEEKDLQELLQAHHRERN